MQLKTTISAIGSDVDISSQLSILKPGATIEASELISLSDAKAVKTFRIAE